MKTFVMILKGNRLQSNLDRVDKFVEWIENNSVCGTMKHHSSHHDESQ